MCTKLGQPPSVVLAEDASVMRMLAVLDAGGYFDQPREGVSGG